MNLMLLDAVVITTCASPPACVQVTPVQPIYCLL